MSLFLRLRSSGVSFLFHIFAVSCVLNVWSIAQTGANTGTIRGSVSAGGDFRLHSATVTVLPLGRSTKTDDAGQYEFKNLQPRTYTVVVHAPGLADERSTVQVSAGQVATADFDLRRASGHEEITVTASGTQQSTLEAISSTTSLSSIELVQNAHTSIAQVLDHEPGVSQRGFGPGPSRPVIRGFSGDRVLVMQDGINAGSLGSQSGDHGETVDVLSLERVEIVRGPATLLYGSNAIGGVVNAITGNFEQEVPYPGLTGYLTGVGGTANEQGGGSVGLKYGWKNWHVWGGGGGQRTGDYNTPIGTIVNSRTRNYSGDGGFGWTSPKAFFDLGYNYDNRRYGIPFAAFLESGGTASPDEEIVNIRPKSHTWKLSTGVRDLENAFLSGIRGTFNFTRYRHGEFDGDELGTAFKNDQSNYRILFEQAKHGGLAGSFGFSGAHRNFESVGPEALAPPTVLNNFAVFGLETFDLQRVVLQFGGRFEHNGYTVDQAFAPPRPDRSFNGASASLGARVPLWEGGALVANYTHSFRAPALEELYNNGPHPGNLAFEIGNPDLESERSDGLDLSLRQRSSRANFEANFFAYRVNNFVFLAPTGNIEDGLFEAEYLQGDTRYLGGELNAEFVLHSVVSLHSGMDIVDAHLTQGTTSPSAGISTPSGTPLPKIPPLRGRIGLDFHHKGLSLTPEVVLARSQDDIFVTETRTPGYSVFNLGASYTLPRQHAVHVFSVNSFNLADRLYRNHLSFIKDLAPEIGRGVRFSYTIRFF